MDSGIFYSIFLIYMQPTQIYLLVSAAAHIVQIHITCVQKLFSTSVEVGEYADGTSADG